jgi:hypothetical protein
MNSTKQVEYDKELTKLTNIFSTVDESKTQLVQGLIQDAAFLFAENFVLKQQIAETGMVKIHPLHPDIQKPIPTAQQYLKNINSYAVIIKTLNGVMAKNTVEGDDAFDEFIKGANS